MSRNVCTFAPAFDKQVLCKTNDRDLAQLVAHTSGGREVAGSSPVIPTKEITIYKQMVISFCIMSLTERCPPFGETWAQSKICGGNSFICSDCCPIEVTV